MFSIGPEIDALCAPSGRVRAGLKPATHLSTDCLSGCSQDLVYLGCNLEYAAPIAPISLESAKSRFRIDINGADVSLSLEDKIYKRCNVDLIKFNLISQNILKSGIIVLKKFKWN